MHAIIKGADREHLMESLPVFGVVALMAVIGAFILMVTIVGVISSG